MSTGLYQIESCINSSSITALLSDPSDFQDFTPGHFLIGSRITGIPEHISTDHKMSYSKIWNLTQVLRQRFWHRWSKECLHQLQTHPKWTSSTPDLQVRDMVLLHDPRSTPLQWSIGRISKTFAGLDNKTRAVSKSTKKREVIR
ncbi:integrase catalytic domain-containing protein [Trichonephila inaurata madagascariensis]|uniref:Integrase catalytic domain-containing protein n=1 Tax=Trichonephila inaurata madagascariensis TaxID=2747483 RepID=A0A8X6YIQ7_9ARAC|nr:integrase catalytic domain-containing protein [Trichonephila inaurata madagascariensis]